MRTHALAIAALVQFTGVAHADPHKLTLDEVMAKALAGPRARTARGAAETAEAKLGEARALIYPRISGSVFGTASPKIRCLDPQCTATDPSDFAFRYDGFYGGGQLEITQPLYSFGRASHGFAAAKAGVEAERLLADETAGDVAVDAARAYWGVKLARELEYMLDDGIDQIDKAGKRMDEHTGADAPTLQDRKRLALLLATAQVQRADAAAAERQALAGLRALTGVADADVDDAPLAAQTQALPKSVDGAGRPQAKAARQGAIAADELVKLAGASYYPDLSLVGSAIVARAQGVDESPSALTWDPYNRTFAQLAVVMHWTLEPWSVHAKVVRARAEANRAHALDDLAAAGARYDAETALAEAQAAKDKLEAASAGEKAGHEWVVSLVQAEAVGTVEAKDFADAYIGWFQMRARWAESAFQLNVALVRLARATGAYHAKL